MPKISVLTPSIRPKGLAVTQHTLAAQTFKDFEWLVEIGIPERGHDLNAAYNRMLRRAKGELVIFLQDYIKVEPDFLQKCWKFYKAYPNTFFTMPVGKVKEWGDEPVWDWRNSPDAKMMWTMWEIDCAGAPLALLKAIGGFDEELDAHWSCDNVNVGCRADLAGYKFACFIENEAIAFDHDAAMPHPFRKNFKPDFNNERMDLFRRGLELPPL